MPSLATPEELAKYPPPALPAWLSKPWQTDFDGNKFALLPSPEFQIQFLEKSTKRGDTHPEPYWISNYGPQTWVLMTPFDETVCGGSRGGGKSVALIAWMAMGDQCLSVKDPARLSYIYEPSYRGLLLRKEYQSMAEFIDECMNFYAPLGGAPKDDPVVFTFPSGAKIYTNHLGDKSAFEKYRGWGISRIGIEELTQIEHESWYLKLLGSLRAKKQVRMHAGRQFPALRSQILSTTNPDGPGQNWIKKRFIKLYDESGKALPVNKPVIDPRSKLTRIFIPMSRKENPALRDNAQYTSMLMAQDEVTRRQWMDGDWDIGAGAFFSEFRPYGPTSLDEMEKYPWARHVIEGAELKPWWYRWGSGDWGYDHPAAFHKFCRSERDGRVYVYDEFKTRKVGSFEMGVQIANWWLPDLEKLPDKKITLTFSHDAFSKTDEGRTKAEQIADGIRKVLGPYGACLLKYTDEERVQMESDPNIAQRLFNLRSAGIPDGQMAILLKPASRDRSGGFSYMRELLRFRPILRETQEQLKKRLEDTYSRAGLEAYERELSRVVKPVDEALPKLQIYNRCAGLIRCMSEAMQDEDHPEECKKVNAVEGIGGDDEIDSARMGLRDFKEIEAKMPKAYFVSERMEKIQADYEINTGERLVDVNRLIQVRMTQESRYDRTHGQPTSFSLPRASSGRHRLPNPRR